jgi:phosphopantothenoylcysteine decarboxylase/phosphopantothenate--cysteine ligase
MENSHIIIKVAAVADYRPKDPADRKIKKKNATMELSLEKNIDILKEIGKKKKNQVVVGFAAETQDLQDNAVKKLKEKNLDMIAGNLVGKPDSGFGTDTNKVTLFFKDGTHESLEMMEKDAVAHIILDRIAGLMAQ